MYNKGVIVCLASRNNTLPLQHAVSLYYFLSSMISNGTERQACHKYDVYKNRLDTLTSLNNWSLLPGVLRCLFN